MPSSAPRAGTWTTIMWGGLAATAQVERERLSKCEELDPSCTRDTAWSPDFPIMKIVVTFATESEFRPWRRLRLFTRIGSDESALYRTRIGDVEICAVLTGIGCPNAGRVVRPLFETSPAVCVCSGLAGGLRPEHRSQQVLVAREIRRDGSPRAIKSDENLVELAVGCGAKPVNLIHTSERILLSAVEKQRMGADADAVDMESFVIVKEASARGIPAVAIR